jgi:hypothetical protein
MTAAEKQERYRAKKEARAKAIEATALLPFSDPSPQDMTIIREQVKKELKKSWEPEAKAERMNAERKKGRELAKQADDTFTRARTIGICDCADFFVGKNRVDLAQFLLDHFMIDRETAAGALEADKRVKSMTLESLDKAGAWNKPPLIIR